MINVSTVIAFALGVLATLVVLVALAIRRISKRGGGLNSLENVPEKVVTKTSNHRPLEHNAS